MCGIVGAVAQRNIVPVLIEGLRRLEYRGYDSCGVAVLEPGALKRARSVARVADLDAQVRESHLEGTTGVAHTRWRRTARPSRTTRTRSSSNALALVHNGIIENFESLREALRAKGYEFVSQTDTEVIAHLVHSLYRGNLFDAVREAVGQLHGAYAIAVIHSDQPHTVVGARQGSPLVVGHGDGENFLASDALALAGSTDRFTFLEEGDVCELSLDGVKIVDRNGATVQREIRVVSAYGGAVELGPYRHFMQKEIFEQPRAISDTVPQTDAFDATLFGDAAPRRVRGHRQPADPRVRHELLLGPDREVLARIDREDPDPGRDRERIPLPRIGAEPAPARAGDLAVGRDRRHARRAQARAVARPYAYARGLQRRDERDGAPHRNAVPDARGHRDRRRVDEGVHDAARRAVRAGGHARQTARARRCRAGSRIPEAAAPPCPPR